ncbi:hypothetical protein [Nocardioides ungokensis]|uniref:hypothetical protein n=1 Tax=Nocardioides ungokensis TaxID=1643322 RepID=UPI0015DD920A|nr:hypothetical protein [Nocardioides ungokensis]
MHAGESVEVADLDATALLAFLDQRKLDARIAERDKLRAAAQWCVLHPATADTGTATWGGAMLLGGDLDGDESLGGTAPGGLGVRPEPLAAVLGVATETGMKLIADALDLQHRLPASGDWWSAGVEPYKARTSPRPPTASPATPRSTYAQLADSALCSARRSRPPSPTRSPSSPRAARTREDREAVLARHLRHPAPRVRRHLLARHHRRHPRPHRLPRPRLRPAAQLKALGDTDELEVRKAKALGVIASQQAQLDLTTCSAPTTSPGRVPTRRGRRRPGSTST